MANHIVLFEPLIPANTGNIARTCAATNSYLHLIKPLGFETDDKHLRRAGLDYWAKVRIVYHDSLDDFMATVKDPQHLYLTDTHADHYFLFGKETTGLPEGFMREHEDQCLRIPMTANVRALNLSNCAALVVYEALRQQHFAGLETVHTYEHDKLK